MTTPAHAIEVGAHLPSQDMVESAGQLRTAILANMDENKVVRLRVDDGQGEPEPVTLEPGLSKMLLNILSHLEKGEGVTFVPIQKRMTTQQAADVLNISRPHFVKLLEEGVLPFEKIGRHRRVLARDLFAYKRARDEERENALNELLRADGELY